MQFKRRHELKRTKIEIIPMIDTIFFLLVFFMLSSLALVKFDGLSVNLPKAATARSQPSSDLTITIDKDRRIAVNTRRVPLSALASALVAQAGPKSDLSTVTVVINADFSVPHGLVVGCIDAARSVGVSRFAIATAPADAPVPASAHGLGGMGALHDAP